VILRMCPLSVIDLVGKDAPAILHNLTTNVVKTLEPGGPGSETFITNLKGKCIGHVLAFRTEEGYRLIGAAGQSDAIVALLDQYTIREDAQPRIEDASWQGWLAESLPGQTSHSLRQQSIEIAGTPATLYDVPWLGLSADAEPGFRGRLVLTPVDMNFSGADIGKAIGARTDDGEAGVGDDVDTDTFHRLRIAAGYPWYGVDFDDSQLPQEVNREPETISFTKGCYLGQETVARLDALGKVQKKLVRWSIEGADTPPAVDTKLFAEGEKPVGRLTSVAWQIATGGESGEKSGGEPGKDPSDARRCVAIGFARRTHFDPGAEARGTVDEQEFVAKVVGG